MRWLALSLALVTAAAAAQSGHKRFNLAQNEIGDRVPGERQLVMPAFPKDQNLVKIQVDGSVTFDFFVDLESVSVGSDGVVRYTLLARSDEGAINITYEGIKCKGREHTYYAFGRKDRTWVLMRSPKWAAISIARRDRAQAMLHDNYFCPGWTMVRDAAEAKSVLREGGHSRAGGWSPG